MRAKLNSFSRWPTLPFRCQQFRVVQRASICQRHRHHDFSARPFDGIHLRRKIEDKCPAPSVTGFHEHRTGVDDRRDAFEARLFPEFVNLIDRARWNLEGVANHFAREPRQALTL